VPDIPNRDALEAQIAKLLGKYNRQELAKLMELMKNQPMLANVPVEFWNTSQRELVKILMPFSETVYLSAAERMLETIPIGVDWALVNTAAADWARSYSTLLAGQINTTSRGAVASSIRNAIASFFEEGLTMGELEKRLASDPELMKLFTSDVRDRLGRVYGPRRAAMIARTEVTNVAMQGEVGIVNELAREGIHMIAVWQTRNDELVCPICGPRHGKKKGDGWYSETAAHPSCRCWVNHEFEEPINV
jgi:hypothetical protein